MSKETTIIELLNKIAKKEKVPEKIRYLGNEYILNHANTYVNPINSKYLLGETYNNLILNDKVEILEEDKPIIEKLNLDREPLKGKEVPRAIDYLLEGRINEIIDYINKKEKK